MLAHPAGQPGPDQTPHANTERHELLRRTQKRRVLLWGKIRVSQGRGFEHRSTRGFEHVKNWETKQDQTGCCSRPPFLGTPWAPSRVPNGAPAREPTPAGLEDVGVGKLQDDLTQERDREHPERVLDAAWPARRSRRERRDCRASRYRWGHAVCTVPKKGAFEKGDLKRKVMSSDLKVV